jgi:hypothetical protein
MFEVIQAPCMENPACTCSRSHLHDCSAETMLKSLSTEVLASARRTTMVTVLVVIRARKARYTKPHFPWNVSRNSLYPGGQISCRKNCVVAIIALPSKLCILAFCLQSIHGFVCMPALKGLCQGVRMVLEHNTNTTFTHNASAKQTLSQTSPVGSKTASECSTPFGFVSMGLSFDGVRPEDIKDVSA